jgi:hypothetical protein
MGEKEDGRSKTARNTDASTFLYALVIFLALRWYFEEYEVDASGGPPKNESEFQCCLEYVQQGILFFIDKLTATKEDIRTRDLRLT